MFRELELLVFGFKTCTRVMQCLPCDILYVFQCYHHVLAAPIEPSGMVLQIILRWRKVIAAQG